MDHLITVSRIWKHIISPYLFFFPSTFDPSLGVKSPILCNQVLVEHDCWIILNWRHMSGGCAVCIISWCCPLGLIHRGYLQLLPHLMHSLDISICKWWIIYKGKLAGIWSLLRVIFWNYLECIIQICFQSPLLRVPVLVRKVLGGRKKDYFTDNNGV